MKRPNSSKIRYSEGFPNPRHVVVAFSRLQEDQRKNALKLREWINSATSYINRVIDQLSELVQDVPRFRINFEHSQGVDSESAATSWASILEYAADHQGAHVRVLTRFSKPIDKIEQGSVSPRYSTSHLLGIQIGNSFQIESARGICNLSMEIPLDRQAFLNVLTDIVCDIFLFHHLAAIRLGAGNRKLPFSVEALSAISAEKLEFAKRHKLKLYGKSVSDYPLCNATYVCFSGCFRPNILDKESQLPKLFATWETFFDDQFPEINANFRQFTTDPDELASRLADSLLSLTKIGGQLSRRRIIAQIKDHLSSGARNMVFCYVHRSPPTSKLKQQISTLMKQRCRFGIHAIIPQRQFANAAQLAPYVLPIRIFQGDKKRKK